MEMWIFVLLLCIAVVVASGQNNSIEHTTHVNANSGSGLSSNLSENDTSEGEKERYSPKEISSKKADTEVYRNSEAEKTGGFSGNSDREGNEDAAKKTMALIDPNAILKVEIKISKNRSRRKYSMSPRKDNGSEQDASRRNGEDSREDNDMHNANTEKRAPLCERSTVVSSVLHSNGIDTRSGGHLRLKKQIIEIVPCEPKKRVLASKSISAASLHSLSNSDTRHLENFEGGLSVLCILSKNINLIKEKIPHRDSVGRVRDVLVLKGEEDDVKDYWGRLEFRESDGTYVDETGFYEGKLVGSTKELLDSGKLTKNGFYQSKDLPESDVEKDFQVTKFLLSAISKVKETSISDMARENCDLPLVDRLLFARRYTYKETPKRETVCICSDALCKEPCKEIKQIDAKRLE